MKKPGVGKLNCRCPSNILEDAFAGSHPASICANEGLCLAVYILD